MIQRHAIQLFALALVASCACGRGATPTPTPTSSPPDSTGEETSPDEASIDASVNAPVDAAPAATVDAGTSGGTSGYRVQSLIKCTITGADDDGIEFGVDFTCERAVKRGWSGNLWDDRTDKPIPNSHFVVAGSLGPDRLKAAARLPHRLADYGDVKTVRIVEKYD